MKISKSSNFCDFYSIVVVSKPFEYSIKKSFLFPPIDIGVLFIKSDCNDDIFPYSLNPIFPSLSLLIKKSTNVLFPEAFSP